MPRHAIIRDGVVENVVEWDGEPSWTAPPGTQLVQSDVAAPGDTFAGGVFTRPDQPPDAGLTSIVTILAKQDADITAGELKEVTLRTLRRLRDRGTLS